MTPPRPNWAELFQTRLPYPEYMALYNAYIRSPEWRQKADDAKRRAGYACQFDSKHTTQLEAHHRTYERLGRELPEDITVLCRSCHQLFEDNKHQLFKDNKHLLESPSSSVIARRDAGHKSIAPLSGEIIQHPSAGYRSTQLKPVTNRPIASFYSQGENRSLNSTQPILNSASVVLPRKSTTTPIRATQQAPTVIERLRVNNDDFLLILIVSLVVLALTLFWATHSFPATSSQQSTDEVSAALQADCSGGTCATVTSGATVHGRPSTNGLVIRRYGSGDSVGLIGYYAYKDTGAVWFQMSNGGWINAEDIKSPPHGLPLIEVPASRLDQPTAELVRATATPKPIPTQTPKPNVAGRRN